MSPHLSDLRRGGFFAHPLQTTVRRHICLGGRRLFPILSTSHGCWPWGHSGSEEICHGGLGVSHQPGAPVAPALACPCLPNVGSSALGSRTELQL